MTSTYYYTRAGSPEKIPARSQTMAESYAEIHGGEVHFGNQFTSPLSLPSEELQMNRTTLLAWLLQVFSALSNPQARADFMELLAVAMRVWGHIKPAAIPAPPVSDGGLSLTMPSTLAICDPDWTDPGEPTAEEDKLVAEIGKLVTADSAGKGTQPLFDSKGFLGIATWLMQNPQALAWIIGLLSRK